MCQSAMNADTGDEIDDMGDVRKLAPLIFWAGEKGEHLADNFCLCWVDLPTTLVEAGYRVWRNPDVIPEYLFDKPPVGKEQVDD